MGLFTPSDTTSYWLGTKPSTGQADGYFVRPAASSHGSHRSRSHHHKSSHSHSHSRHRSRSRSHSPSRHRGSYHHQSTHYTSTSRRRPRHGYIAYLLHKLRSLWRYVYRYARRHPVKIFFMVIMPLLSGGVLTGLLKKFGISLPVALTRFAAGMSGGGGRRGGGGYYGSKGYEGLMDLADGVGGGGRGGGILSDGLGAMGGVGGLVKLASNFM